MDTKRNSTTPRTWGVPAAEFYAGLRDQPIQAVTLDGKIYKGVLVGVDQYDVFLKQSGGAVILLAKHAIKFIQADAPAANG